MIILNFYLLFLSIKKRSHFSHMGKSVLMIPINLPNANEKFNDLTHEIEDFITCFFIACSIWNKN
jgi:hypothetical protein